MQSNGTIELPTNHGWSALKREERLDLIQSFPLRDAHDVLAYARSVMSTKDGQSDRRTSTAESSHPVVVQARRPQRRKSPTSGPGTVGQVRPARYRRAEMNATSRADTPIEEAVDIDVSSPQADGPNLSYPDRTTVVSHHGWPHIGLQSQDHSRTDCEPDIVGESRVLTASGSPPIDVEALTAMQACPTWSMNRTTDNPVALDHQYPSFSETGLAGRCDHTPSDLFW